MTSMNDMGEGAWLVFFLVAQRLAELAYAQWNTVRLRAAGAVEFGAGHYPFIVVLHAGWLMALWIAGHGRPIDPLWFATFVILQVARLWTLLSLGSRWTTRILVLPGAPPVRRGPYRWLRHPNYLIVLLEIVVVPLALGLPGLAAGFGLANAGLLAWRIRVENRALIWARTAAAGPEPDRPVHHFVERGERA